MGERLTGKVALITGGTSGIGAATAELFIAEGAQVALAGRSEEMGQALAENLGANAIYLKCDVTDEADIAATVAATSEHFGRLDILFNNAGGPVGAPVDALSQDHIDYGVRLLLSSVILGTRYAVEPMKASGGGAIINNLAKAVPLKQAGLASDIAEAALYLSSDAGRFVNCHDLVVDGGRTSMFYEPND